MFKTILGSAQVNSGENTEINKQSHVKFWLNWMKYGAVSYSLRYRLDHGLRTPGEEIAFTAQPKIHSTPKFLGTVEAYFVCHIGPEFHVSLIYAFIGCP